MTAVGTAEELLATVSHIPEAQLRSGVLVIKFADQVESTEMIRPIVQHLSAMTSPPLVLAVAGGIEVDMLDEVEARRLYDQLAVRLGERIVLEEDEVEPW